MVKTDEMKTGILISFENKLLGSLTTGFLGRSALSFLADLIRTLIIQNLIFSSRLFIFLFLLQFSFFCHHSEKRETAELLSFEESVKTGYSDSKTA
jgi:hypothetical protein